MGVEAGRRPLRLPGTRQVVLRTIPLPIHFLRPVPFSSGWHPQNLSLVPPLWSVSTHVLLLLPGWSPFPSWGLDLVPPPPHYCSLLERSLVSEGPVPEGGDGPLWAGPRFTGCAGAEGVWPYPSGPSPSHPGEELFPQFSNSEHVCVGVFLCIHPLPPAYTAGLRVTRAALSGRGLINLAGVRPLEGPGEREGVRAKGLVRWRLQERAEVYVCVYGGC